MSLQQQFSPHFEDASFFKKALWASFVLHLIATYFSFGALHPDEHFQVLEFAKYKLHGDATLTWEYDARIRPWLQPFLTFLGFKFLDFFKISDPFTLATTARYLHSAMSFLGTVALVYTVPRFFSKKNTQNAVVAILCFFYFFLFLHARTSSENASTAALSFLFFCWTHACSSKQWFLPAGVFAALAFQLRYQTAFFVLGLALHLVLFERSRFRAATVAAASFIATTLLCVLLDSWLYGQWTVAPFRYFQENLLKGKAAEFGVHPWYEYFVLIAQNLKFPFGILVLVSSIAAIILKPKHIVVWPLTLFLLGHILVGHKEFRFIFPFLQFWPFLLGICYEKYISSEMTQSRLFKISMYSLIVLNMVFIVRYSLRPLNKSLMVVKFLSENAVESFYYVKSDPFVWAGLTQKLYLPDSMQPQKIESIEALRQLTLKEPVFITSNDASELANVQSSLANCTRVFSTATGYMWSGKKFASNEKIIRRLARPGDWHVLRCLQ